MTRILVVEDEPTIATGLRDDFEFEGFEVDVVTDGPTAVERAGSDAYSMILLDVMLPGKDGFAVCRELREAGVATPIIMLTARGEEIDKVLGLEFGADDYVTKPFSPRELLARVHAALRRGAESTSPASCRRFGDIEVDSDRCEVRRHGRPIELTATEFKLLATLVGHPGHVLSIDNLIAAVWGPDSFQTDRVVYTHVNNLRHKIEDDPSSPRHLITVRGMGYRFDP